MDGTGVEVLVFYSYIKQQKISKEKAKSRGTKTDLCRLP